MTRRGDPNQTLINWSNPETAPVAPAASIPDPVKLAAQALPQLVQYLPWDFKTTFPQPTDEAIDAGFIEQEDCTPENIRSLHEEQANEMLGILRDLDTVMDARRRGIDSTTGKVPRTQVSREHLKRYHQDEPKRLEQYFNILMETYENAFGAEAANAFAKCIRARHAGIPIEIANRMADLDSADRCPTPRPAVKRKSPASLPVPKPLPEAIAAGHFGEEDGKSLKPTAGEVRAITEHHAETIIDLLDGLREAERHLARGGDGAQVARLRAEVKAAIDQYAASFGPEAGERLEAHCRRQQVAGHGGAAGASLSPPFSVALSDLGRRRGNQTKCPVRSNRQNPRLDLKDFNRGGTTRLASRGVNRGNV